MRVVFNLLSTLKAKAGVGHYAARLFHAMRRMLPEESLHGFPGGRLEALVRRVQASSSKGGPATNRLPSPFAKATAAIKDTFRNAGHGCLSLAFRRACRRGAFDLYHEPNFVPFASNVPTIVTVHDLSVILHPEWHPTDRVRRHESLFGKGVDGVRHIITDTEFVRRQVIEHLGIVPSRVTAIHIGVGAEYFAAGPIEEEHARRELNLPRDYLLYVGTIEPRKNLLTVLRAYCDLPAELRQRCPFVIAGGWGWKSTEVADFLRGDGKDRSVIHLGYTDARHLPGLYAGARALVYPSHYEGFGLPPIETLACGGAVLASTADALREVLGSHAHFVEPLELDGWRGAMKRAITENDWLSEIRRGGRAHAARFTWDRCAAATLNVYSSALQPIRLAA